MADLNEMLVAWTGEIDSFMYTYILVILLVFVGIYYTCLLYTSTVQDKSDADVLAVEDVAEEAALKTASSRDVSAGVQEIADEEEAARLAAEEAARVAEQEAIDRADAMRSRYYATFGLSLIHI